MYSMASNNSVNRLLSRLQGASAIYCRSSCLLVSFNNSRAAIWAYCEGRRREQRVTGFGIPVGTSLGTG